MRGPSAFLAIPTLVFLAVLLHGCGDVPWFHEAPDSSHEVRSSLPVRLPKLPWAMPNPVPWTNDGNADSLLHCPPGYISKTHSKDTAKVQTLILAGVGKALSDCGFRCDNTSSCKAFMFGSEERRCVVLHNDEPGDGVIGDYRFCLKMKTRQFGSNEAPLLRPSEYVQQEHAEIEVGEDIKIYAIGSSSLLWMTWLDQLHLVLRRLGYRLPVVPSKIGARLYTLQAPTCDDSQYFEYLRTTRYAKIGWSSWDFGFEGWEDCKNGWRDINGIKIKCQHGAGCNFGKDPVYTSQLAEDASGSNITLLATWYNDDQQWSTHFKCFDGIKMGSLQVAPLSITMLLRMIRAIHQKNPHTLVLVMGKYPQTFRHVTYPFLKRYNKMVKEAVEREPRTLFVDFYMPNEDEGSFYQIAHGGHPNCRGSKLLAHSVMDRLFKAKILSRSIRLGDTNKHGILNPNCSHADLVDCQTSALCWVDPQDNQCKTYSPGSWDYHTICEGSMCTGFSKEQAT
jgi:hypothetical protein